jgi:hypothetical protein
MYTVCEIHHASWANLSLSVESFFAYKSCSPYFVLSCLLSLPVSKYTCFHPPYSIQLISLTSFVVLFLHHIYFFGKNLVTSFRHKGQFDLQFRKAINTVAYRPVARRRPRDRRCTTATAMQLLANRGMVFSACSAKQQLSYNNEKR